MGDSVYVGSILSIPHQYFPVNFHHGLLVTPGRARLVAEGPEAGSTTRSHASRVQYLRPGASIGHNNLTGTDHEAPVTVVMTRPRLILVAAILAGLTIGIGGYTFVYAKGYSYLTNDPAACANCHIMQDHYRAWTRASHHAVAVCNDCHTPPGLGTSDPGGRS
jgi:hypothetical protein